MTDSTDESEDPLDGYRDEAEVAAAHLISSAKKAGLSEVEIPVVDEAHVWAVTVKKMGIEGAEEEEEEGD